MGIQAEMADRALELLALPGDSRMRLILDLGCGSGLSGSVISKAGHYWVGVDISQNMLSKMNSVWMLAYHSAILDVASERLQEQCENKAIFDEVSNDEMEMESDDGGFNDYSGDCYNNDDSDDGDEDEIYEGLDSPISEAKGNYREKCMNLLLGDMGEGTPFRPGTFDGCISISALQWLCHSNRSQENPKARLIRLFSTLFSCLSRGARAVFQFYPETSSQIDLILACAMKAGFTGGLVVDNPNSSRAKKYFLCLMTGPLSELPRGLENDARVQEESQIGVDKRTRKRGRKEELKNIKDKAWIMKKKESARKRGEKVKADSKYTARRRRIRF